MEEDSDLYLSSFKIVFNDKVIQIDYDISFKEYKTQTIESLIKEVLEKIGPKPLNKAPQDYVLFCPCGAQLEHNKLLYKSKCLHKSQEDFSKEKNKNGKYLLIEKEYDEEQNINEEELSKDEIDKILKKIVNKKKSKNKTEKNSKQKKKKECFKISNSLRNRIKEYKIKLDRGKKIEENSKPIYYNAQFYKDLIEMGINKNKAKASLRLSNNDKEEAILISTDEKFYWDNKEYLFYDNNEVLSTEKFNNLCMEEIRKEYPFLIDVELKKRFTEIIKYIDKINPNNISSDIDEIEEKEDNS